MANIGITGATGTIGRVLIDHLPGQDTSGIRIPRREEIGSNQPDIPYEAALYNFLYGAFSDKECIIHLAWDTVTENWRSNKINPDNTLMYLAVYQAALQQGVKRVIMASSVHADEWLEHVGKEERKVLKLDDMPGFQHEPISYGLKSPELLDPYKTPPRPNTPYGSNKHIMEETGKFHATHNGLEVICVRFGGVSPNDAPYPGEESVFLSHNDCRSLILRSIEAELKKPPFGIIYGVSNNEIQIVSWANDIGYVPQDGAKKLNSGR